MILGGFRHMVFADGFLFVFAIVSFLFFSEYQFAVDIVQG
jgi:hypothetical protein